MIWLCGFMSDPGDAGREPVLETLCRDAREEAHEMEVKTALKRCRGAQRLPGHVLGIEYGTRLHSCLEAVLVVAIQTRLSH